MILDNNYQFSNAQALTVTAASTNAVDLTGAGSGNAPKLSFGNASTFGEDLGIGDGEAIPKLAINVGTAFTAAGAATMVVSFQGAPDAGNNTAGTWTTYGETNAIAVASLTAGAKIPLFWDQVALGAALPRFVRLYYTIATGPMTAGTISAYLALQRDDNIVGKYPAGFSVAS